MRGLKLTEGLVYGFACAVLGVGPEVGVGVEGLCRAGVAEAGLDGLDRFAVADQQAGVVVAEVV